MRNHQACSEARNPGTIVNQSGRDIYSSHVHACEVSRTLPAPTTRANQPTRNDPHHDRADEHEGPSKRLSHSTDRQQKARDGEGKTRSQARAPCSPTNPSETLDDSARPYLAAMNQPARRLIPIVIPTTQFARENRQRQPRKGAVGRRGRLYAAGELPTGL